MSPLRFLRSRYRLIAYFAVYAVFLVAAAALDPAPRPSAASAAYMAALAAGMALIFLAIEWAIVSPYYEAMGSCARGAASPLDIELPVSPPGESEEPLLLAERIRRDALAEIEARRASAREDVEFIAAWVHELKTPVTALRLMAESGELARSEVEAELDRIEDRLRKALCYARSSDFASDSIIGEVDPEKAVRVVLGRLARFFIAKELKPDLHGPWYELRSDPKWLDFILEQLLSNAAKYSLRGGAVKVSMERDEEMIRLIVEDEGIGIKVEDQRRLFEKSFTGANGRSELSATGFGLYLSKKLADRLGHGFSIESDEGEGTRAILSFPRLSDWHDPARVRSITGT